MQSIKNELAAIADRLKTLSEIVPTQASSQAADGFPADKLALVSDRICLRCGLAIEEHEKPVRGNHSRCYKATDRDIKAGIHTDQEAIELGLLTELGKSGRKPSSEKLGIVDRVKELRRQKAKRASDDSKSSTLLPPGSP